MTKKQKQNVLKGLLLGVFAFFLWVIVFFNLPITETSSEFVVNQNEWTTNLVNNLINNHIFYLIVAGILLLGYLFVTKKKR